MPGGTPPPATASCCQALLSPRLRPRPDRTSSVLAFLAGLFCNKARPAGNGFRVPSHAGTWPPRSWLSGRVSGGCGGGRQQPVTAGGCSLPFPSLGRSVAPLDPSLACLGDAFFFSADLGAILLRSEE